MAQEKIKVVEGKIDQLIPDDKNMNVVIYLYSCPITGEPKYIGKTVNLKNRIKQHSLEARKGTRTRFYSWLRKHINTIPSIVEYCDARNWMERERYWIKHFRGINPTLTNILDGGDGFDHKYNTEEYRDLMSRSAKLKFKNHPELKERYVAIYGKLDESEIEQIFIDYHKKAISTCRLSKKYNIAQSTISEILNGKRYSHISKRYVSKYGVIKTRTCSIDKDNVENGICNDYRNGLSINELLKKYNIHRVTVFRHIKNGTGKTYQKHEKENLRRRIKNIYISGERASIKEISEMAGCDYTLVCKVVKEINSTHGKN